jgi:hypothetical protein
MFAEPCRRGFEGEPGRPESPRAHRSARGEIFQQREGVLHEAIDDQAGARHAARGIPSLPAQRAKGTTYVTSIRIGE